MVAVFLVLLGTRQGGDDTRGELQCCSSQGRARAPENARGLSTPANDSANQRTRTVASVPSGVLEAWAGANLIFDDWPGRRHEAGCLSPGPCIISNNRYDCTTTNKAGSDRWLEGRREGGGAEGAPYSRMCLVPHGLASQARVLACPGGWIIINERHNGTPDNKCAARARDIFHLGAGWAAGWAATAGNASLCVLLPRCVQREDVVGVVL